MQAKEKGPFFMLILLLKDLLANYLNSTTKATLLGPRLGPQASNVIKTEKLILVDGARSAFKEKPASSLLIGDGDSCAKETRAEFDFLCDPEKSQSDLSLVLENLPATVKELTLLGFRGGRLDHELFNLGELSFWLAKGEGRSLTHEDDLQGFSAGEWSFDFTGLFSLITLADTVFTLEGAIRYPMKNQTVAPLQSLTLSNQAYGGFKLLATGPFFLFRDLSSETEQKDN